MSYINWVLDPGKFLSRQQVHVLLRTAKKRAETALTKNHKVPIRDYFLVHLALSTGLRVMEIAQLNCGDIFIRDDLCSLLVRKGKCHKRRIVRFNGAFRKHYEEYIRWKQEIGEPTNQEAPLILSSNSGKHMTTRAIQKAFKRTASRAGLPLYFSIHCLRHTYASQLYKSSKYNLRLVQKQLGHSSSRITEVYVDVMELDIQKALEKLYA